MSIFLRGVGALLLVSNVANAHPNHRATQAMEVTLVPSTQKPDGMNEVRITVEGTKRVIVSNGLPDHLTGRFPNADNPNGIRPQRHRFTVPLAPVVNERATPLGRRPFGVAVNGVLFDPGTAEAWMNDRSSGWSYEAKGNAFSLGLDTNNAHVQPNGAYHYHGVPIDLLARLSGRKPQMTLVGWAADGFPVYGVWAHREPANAASPVLEVKSSYRLKEGRRPTVNGQPGGTYDGIFVEDFEYIAGAGDLDECSGRFGVTPEFPEGVYHYVLTEDFPFVPRAFRGTPDSSFISRGGPGGAQRPGARGNSP